MLLSEKDLERLLGLSLISIKDEKAKQKMLLDLEQILDYFSVLKEVETGEIMPSFSGHSEDLISRFSEKSLRVDAGLLNQKKGDYIKGPNIF